jgi:hypothetical protein
MSYYLLIQASNGPDMDEHNRVEKVNLDPKGNSAAKLLADTVREYLQYTPEKDYFASRDLNKIFVEYYDGKGNVESNTVHSVVEVDSFPYAILFKCNICEWELIYSKEEYDSVVKLLKEGNEDFWEDEGRVMIDDGEYFNYIIKI